MLSEKQMAVLAFPYSRYDTLIADGSIRSGKTSAMTVSFIDWAMRTFSGQNLIILGYTLSAVVRNVLDPAIDMAYLRSRYTMRYINNQARLYVVGPNGRNTFHVFGADNARSFRKIQGLTAAGCLVDEVALCDPGAVKQALARCSVDGARYFFNSNPADPNHWFYREWIMRAGDQNALYLHFTMDDNPGLADNVKERFKRQYRGVFYQRYIEGLWVVAEGLIYQFDRSEYVIGRDEASGKADDAEFGPGSWYISCDYGITNPFAAILWRVTQSCAYAVDEYYFASREEGRRLTDSEHYEAIEALAKGHNIESIIIDPSASSMVEEIGRHGRFDVVPADNNVLDGIQTVTQMLSEGRIKVSERCRGIIDEMGLYRWDETSTAGTRPIKEDDHAMDAMRYMAHTVLRFELAGW